MAGGGLLAGHHEDGHMAAENLTLRDPVWLFFFTREVLPAFESLSQLDEAIIGA